VADPPLARNAILGLRGAQSAVTQSVNDGGQDQAQTGRRTLRSIDRPPSPASILTKYDAVLVAAGLAPPTAALDLMSDPQALYQQSTDEGRRLLTQAFFDRLYVDERLITDDRLAEPFDAFEPGRPMRTAYERRRRAGYANGAPKGAAYGSKTSAALLATALVGAGSSKAAMVEVAGIEPVRTVWKRWEPLGSSAKSRLAG